MKLLPSMKQLEYLTALVETRHFGQAAERCNVTPSTLSAGIRDLEAVLGVVVAERTKRSVLIAPVGLAVAERARRILRDAEDLMALAAAEKEPMTGDVRLGAIPTVGPFVLPRLLPAVAAEYPALRLYLREDQTASLVARLRAGELDVVLLALPTDTENLTVRVLFEDPFLFACNAGHPFAGHAAISDEDLADQPLLLLEEGHCLRSHSLEACKLDKSAARVQFEATSLQTLVQMAAMGLGVTLLPQMAVDAGIAAMPGLRLIPLARPAARQIGLVWRASSPRATAFEALADLFAARGSEAAA